MATDDVAGFMSAIVETTSDLVCAYKPNVAFYEALGPERGYDALRKVMSSIPPHVVTLADAKRGDVEHTARAYVRALFDDLGFDAATVNPYLGADSVEPWIEREEHAAFIVCRTSNPGAPDFQDLLTEDPHNREAPHRRMYIAAGGDDDEDDLDALAYALHADREADAPPRRLYEAVASAARRWDRFGNVGLVAGATYPREMKGLRDLCPEQPFLVPGIGAQQGALGDAVRAGVDRHGRGLLVSASRGVTYASQGKDFAKAARREAERLRDEINREREAIAAARS
jgi:orotidine-5'-phosphate decarboxylase